jgi:hypothetical protein
MESISTRTQFAANAGHRSGTYAFDTDAEYVRVGLIRLLQPIPFLHPLFFPGAPDRAAAFWATARWKKDHDDPGYRIPPFRRDRRAG